MAFLNETPNYETGIYQLETTDPALGGANGIINTPARQLANRTAQLKAWLDGVLNTAKDKVPLAKVEGAGTAAGKNFGVSLGNLLELGTLGVMGAANLITDCDSFAQFKHGWNRINAATANKPAGVASDAMMITQSNGTDYHWQVVFDGKRIYARVFIVDVWTAWAFTSFRDDVGTVVAAAYSGSPGTGWLRCNGAAVSRTTYAELFARIGTTFGVGNGTTTFNVPDLRGEFVRGWDNGRGVDTGRAFGSAQADELKSHQHELQDFSAGGGGLIGSDLAFIPSGNYVSSGAAGQIAATGGTETRPRNIALQYFICFQ